MRDYPIKRGHFKNIEGEQFPQLLKDYFGDFSEKDGNFEASFGTLTRISISFQGKTRLMVETEAKKEGSDEEEMMNTHRVYNSFLQKATGFNAKERMKKMKKSGDKKKK